MRRAAFACAAVCAALLVAPARGNEFSEDAVKAAFLYRFAAYVQWPSRAARDETFVIAVAGADGVHAELDRLLPKVRLQERPARAIDVEHPDQLADARILYVGTERMALAAPLIAAATARSVLVVTDHADGLARGATINFVRSGRRIRFEISLQSASRNGLRIKSDLLSVATRVTGTEPRDGG